MAGLKEVDEVDASEPDWERTLAHHIELNEALVVRGAASKWPARTEAVSVLLSQRVRCP